MNKLFLFTFLTVLIDTVKAQKMWQINKDTVIVWYYQDGDEFDFDNLKQKWNPTFGWARCIASNKEQQYYTDYKNTTVKDGCLNITVEKNPIKARLVDWLPDNDTVKTKGKFDGFNLRDFKYRSGMLQSKHEFLRGCFEIKFKAPNEFGLWPAFWLYGGTPNKEIDFMELHTSKQSEIHIDTHCPDRCDYFFKNIFGRKISFGNWIKLTDKLNTGFNVVAGIWDENGVKYFLNGNLIGISNVPFIQPQSLVVNVAVPIKGGPFGPGPDDNIQTFSPMEIDYIRVWTKETDKKTKLIANNESYKIETKNTEAKKLAKYTYKSKSDVQMDDVFISYIKTTNGDLRLYCNGLNQNEAYVLKRFEGTKYLNEMVISERELSIKESDLSNIRYEIHYLGHQIKLD